MVMTQRFSGKVALVTGAAGGIGLATARAFAAEGARVMLADLDLTRAEMAAQEICAAGLEAAAVKVDVADFASCQNMVTQTVARFGGLHIAFNNAGIPSAIGGAFEDYPVEDWRRLLDVNLSGVFYAMKAEVAEMRAGGGAIVNTASITSLVAAPGMAAYVASKHGVAGLTKAAAMDLVGAGIRVNAIAPGFFDTPMLAGAIEIPAVKADILAKIPLGRIGNPDEAARAVLFLASEEASYMVGTMISVDGGVVVQ